MPNPKQTLLTPLRKVSLACALAVSGAHAIAAEIAPPDCPKPDRPAEFRNSEHANKYWRKAEGFQQCLMKYAKAQKALSDQHGKAANDAIGQWNAFVAENSTRDEETAEQKAQQKHSQ